MADQSNSMTATLGTKTMVLQSSTKHFSHDHSGRERRDVKRRRSIVVKFIALSLLLHAFALIVIGNITIWQYLNKPDEAVLEAPPAPSAPQTAVRIKTSMMDRTPQASKSRITVTNVNMMDIPDMNITIPSMGGRVGFGGFGGKLGVDLKKTSLNIESLFGGSEAGKGKLEGYLYDLKRDKSGKVIQHPVAGRLPYGSQEHYKAYDEVMNSLFRRNWNESILDNFARSPFPLYANQFFIPMMSANEAPKSFGLEKEMEGAMWIAHYKGEMISQVSGRFRLVGRGDDVLMVRINRRVVFDGNLRPYHEADQEQTGVNGDWRIGGLFWNPVAGEWFNLQKGRAVDVEVLLGEMPGGHFGSVLMLQEANKDYPQLNGAPILPIFSTSALSEAQVDLINQQGGGYISTDNPITQ